MFKSVKKGTVNICTFLPSSYKIYNYSKTKSLGAKNKVSASTGAHPQIPVAFSDCAPERAKIMTCATALDVVNT